MYKSRVLLVKMGGDPETLCYTALKHQVTGVKVRFQVESFGVVTEE